MGLICRIEHGGRKLFGLTFLFMGVALSWGFGVDLSRALRLWLKSGLCGGFLAWNKGRSADLLNGDGRGA